LISSGAKLARFLAIFLSDSKIKITVLFLTVIGAIFLLSKFPFLIFWVFLFIAFLYLSNKKSNYIFVLLIFTSVLSPKINLGTVSANLIGIKIDDILVLSLCLSVLRNYLRVRTYPKPPSALLPFIIFICVGAISLLRGIFIHSVDKPLVSLLVMFKWIEYLVIFCLGSFCINSRKNLKLILITTILTGIVLAFYGYWEYFNPRALARYLYYYRLYDRGWFTGQNNHIAGFFLLWFCLILGLLGSAQKIKYKILLGFSAIVGMLPFLASYSRKSYIALAFSVVVLALLTGKKRYLAVFLLLLFIMTSFFGVRLIDRFNDIKKFFLASDTYQSERFYFFRPWAISLKTLESFPFLGAGFGSRHRLFYESQWVMIAAETGLLGLVFFFYTLLLILKSAFLRFKTSADWLMKGFALGFISGFLGIFVHSLTCLSLIVSRIGVSFWLLAGIIAQTNITLDKKSAYE
jgi:hypothetical protein